MKKVSYKETKIGKYYILLLRSAKTDYKRRFRGMMFVKRTSYEWDIIQSFRCCKDRSILENQEDYRHRFLDPSKDGWTNQEIWFTVREIYELTDDEVNTILVLENI